MGDAGRMELGIHLPQYGRLAQPGTIERAARHAEELGFDHVWVSDHVVHPASQDYPSPYLYDPLISLTWAAAVTERVRLGTSVMVVPQHNPLTLANAIASLDSMSGGRVLLGVGVGWSAPEFGALGYDFDNRGARTDEILQLFRTVWRDDPASFQGQHYQFDDIRVLPQPAHEIPIWVGGAARAAHRRAVALGDGFQLIGVTPEEAVPIVESCAPSGPSRPSRSRCEPDGIRRGWTPLASATSAPPTPRRACSA